MKLQDLDARRPIEQLTKVLESQHGAKFDFDRMSTTQAHSMLKKVRALVQEHRNGPGFHFSERNQGYIKLVMMEQALTSKINEVDEVAAAVGTAPVQNPGQSAALQSAQLQKQKQQIQLLIRNKQKEIQDLQKQMNNPAAMTTPMAEDRRKLREGEINQAQVVLAGQDMVDQVQKMLEQISEMQFKDLPALTYSIRNDIGTEQATQFQTDAAAALTALLASVQAGKTQLENAQGVLTGQAPAVPGDDAELGAELGADAGAELGADAGAELGAELGADSDGDPEPDEDELEVASLGRERR